MKIYVTGELTPDMFDKLNSILNEMQDAFLSFENVSYGQDLKELYIGAFCMDEKMASFFKLRRPQYRKEAKEYVHRGVLLNTGEGTFMYELQLDYNKYKFTANVRELLVNDALLSFDVIAQQKQIKDFDLDAFRRDFKKRFEALKWI